MKKLIAFLAVLVLMMILCACGAKPAEAEAAADNGAVQENILHDGDVIGEGATTFTLQINDGEETISVTVSTDEETVGATLTALGVIDGEMAQYGMYIKTVNGLTVDYDKDGAYWSFYVNGEYAAVGIDSTVAEQDAVYLLAVEQG